jgi:hypothetical protein
MSIPVPGRKLSTADLATPPARTDTGEGPEQRQTGPVVAGPEARRAATDDAGEQMPPIDAIPVEARTDNPTENRTDTHAETRTEVSPRDRTTSNDDEVSALFADDECHGLWKRWDDIQAGFVDEPRRAVQDADTLVAETMQQLANTFARERGNLEQQWGRGDNVSTEDLRIAFRRYRSFFKRLLSV